MKTNRINSRSLRRLLAVCLLGGVGLTSACNLEMRDDSHLKPYEASPVFADHRSSRPIVAGTVPHTDGQRLSDVFLTGKTPDGQPTAEFPLPITEELLATGKKNYDIYCSVCHGYSGYADGMVVRRGFPAPPSYHIERLRRAPVGHIYDVITHGYGVMYSYNDRIQRPEDRWAVAAYVKALQYSQHVPEAELTNEQRAQLTAQPKQAE